VGVLLRFFCVLCVCVCVCVRVCVGVCFVGVCFVRSTMASIKHDSVLDKIIEPLKVALRESDPYGKSVYACRYVDIFLSICLSFFLAVRVFVFNLSSVCMYMRLCVCLNGYANVQSVKQRRFAPPRCML